MGKSKKKPSMSSTTPSGASTSGQGEPLAVDVGSRKLKSKQTKSKKSASTQSHNHDVKTNVINEILNQIEECDESVLRKHFDRFPARYWADVDARVEDVCTHIRLLDLTKDSGVLMMHIKPVDARDLDDEIDDAKSLVNPLGKHRHVHEIHFSTIDGPNLFAQLTSLILTIGLNIQEACLFSTIDGYSLVLFHVYGWPFEGTEELDIALKKQILKFKASPVKHDDSRGPLRVLLDRHQTSTDTLPDFLVVPSDDVWEININHLKLGNKVATGSFGKVYKGVYFNQEVAVKVPKLERFNANILTEFTQEIFIMRKIRHKNVVQFIGACTQSPDLCIITEFMSGGSLYDFLHKLKSKFDLPTLLKVAIDVSNGMDCLHQNNIIHRDLKSSNLLMDENGVVKVADFGVARVHAVSREMTPEMGTYIWMAPEVIEHKAYNQKADVFSFGIVLWELVTGEIPYSEMTPLQAAVGVVQRGLRPSIPEDAHPKLASLIEKCWHEHAEMRPDFCDIVVTLQDIASEVGPKQGPSADDITVVVNQF